MTGGPAADRRRPLVAVVLAVVLVGGTILAVLLFGRISLPAFPSLAEHPDPDLEGVVAFTRGQGDGVCVHVVPASGGTSRELACGSTWDPWPRWTEEGYISVTDWRAGARRIVLDPDSGEVVRTETDESEPFGHPGPPGGDGRLSTLNDEGRVEVLIRRPDGSEEVVAEVNGPRDYAIWELSWSPDGRWILAHDSADRLLVVDRDRIRLLAENVRGAAWGNP